MNGIAAFANKFRAAVFFVPAGIILIIVSMFMFKSVDQTKDYIKTEAIVTRTELHEEAYTDSDGNYNEATYTVYVKYTVDGAEYEEEYGIFPNISEGDKVTICYDPANPKEIAQPIGSIVPIIMVIAGALFLLIGIGSVIIKFLRGR